MSETKIVTHYLSQSRTILFFFFLVWLCRFLADDIWTQIKNAVCHSHTVWTVKFIKNCESKAAQLFLVWNSSNCFLLRLLLCFSLSYCVPAHLAPNTRIGLRQLNRSYKRQAADAHTHTYTHIAFNTHLNGDVLFTSRQSRRLFRVYLWDFVGDRWARIYSGSTVTRWRYLFDS